MPTWQEIKKNRNKKKPYVVSFFVFDIERTKRNSFTIYKCYSHERRGQGCKGTNHFFLYFIIFFWSTLLIFASGLKSGLSVVPRVVFWKVLTCLPFRLFLCIFKRESL